MWGTQREASHLEEETAKTSAECDRPRLRSVWPTSGADTEAMQPSRGLHSFSLLILVSGEKNVWRDVFLFFFAQPLIRPPTRPSKPSRLLLDL